MGAADPARGEPVARVRAATAADVELVARFNRAMARETEGLELDPDTLRAGVRAVLDDPRRGFYRVAERGGAVAGCLLVTFEWSDWRAAEIWWIQSVYVDPAHRRRGVYGALHDAVRREARAAGAPALRLYVEEANAGARRVYEAIGMRPSHYRLYEEDLARSRADAGADVARSVGGHPSDPPGWGADGANAAGPGP